MKAYQFVFSSALIAFGAFSQQSLAQSNAVVKGYIEGLSGIAQHRAELNEDQRLLSEVAATGGIRIGVAFNDYVAVEGSYQQFGEVNEGSTGTNGDSYDTETDVRAFRLGTRLSVPLNTWLNLTGRLGFSYWDYDVAIQNETTTSESFRIDDTGNDPYYGVGLRFELNRMFHIGVEYNRSKMQVNLDGQNVDHELGDATVSFGYIF